MGLFDIFKVSDFKQRIKELENENAALSEKLDAWGVFTYEEIQNKIASSESEYKEKKSKADEIREQLEKLLSQTKSASNKLSKSRELYKAIE